jgi:hypothetical protein
MAIPVKKKRAMNFSQSLEFLRDALFAKKQQSTGMKKQTIQFANVALKNTKFQNYIIGLKRADNS